MSHKHKPRVVGLVVESLPNALYRVELDESEKRTVMCYLAGKLKLRHIHILVGDKVEIELDPAGGKATNRIVWRV